MDKELFKKTYEMVGAIKMAKTLGNFVDAARYSLYKQIRDSKIYKTLGKDWKDFCSEDLQSNQNTVNQEIKLLEEYGESFLKAAERIGLHKRELFALGSGLTEDAKAEIKKGVIKIGETEFKVGELQENLDEFRDCLAGLTKQMQESSAAVKAHQRLAEDYRKNNEKLHKQLDKYAKKEEDKSFTSEEGDFLDKMSKLRTGFDGYMLKVDPDRMMELADDTACTDRMKAALAETLGYMKRQIDAAYAKAAERFGDLEDKWEPGKGAAV